MPSSDTDRLAHFKKIARCPVMVDCLTSRASSSPCASIVYWQWQHLAINSDDRIQHWKNWHQLPEPWVGHLDQARILFVSSNPSLSGKVRPNFATAPPPTDRVTARWSNNRLIRRFERAFDDYMDDGIRHRGAKGVVSYWASIKKRAEELLPSGDLRPGWDYALTEVVRCKSWSEEGVSGAVEECAPRYLRTTLELSPAVVIVALGAHARRALVDMFEVNAAAVFKVDPAAGVTTINVGGADRLLAFLPHPNAWGVPKSFAKNIKPQQLRRLQTRLREDGGQA